MSLFNPYVLLGIVLAIFGSFGGGYYKGKHDELARQQLEIAALNAEARQKEQVLIAAVSNQAIKLQKANQNAKLQNQKRDADIAAGVMRLRVPANCAVQATGDASTSSGANLGTAELQPEIARSLIAITDDADQTVRKLNACVTLYNEVRETLRSK